MKAIFFQESDIEKTPELRISKLVMDLTRSNKNGATVRSEIDEYVHAQEGYYTKHTRQSLIIFKDGNDKPWIRVDTAPGMRENKLF